jgi:hypothetical protein
VSAAGGGIPHGWRRGRGARRGSLS